MNTRVHKSRGNWRTIAIVGLIVAVVVTGLVIWNSTRAAGTTTTVTTQAGTNTQINDGGQVTVKVTWPGKVLDRCSR